MVRRTVIQILGTWQHSEHIPLFIEALADEGGFGMVADTAEEALSALGARTLPLLREALNHTNAEIIRRASRVIERIQAND